jgi:hypothetical protein
MFMVALPPAEPPARVVAGVQVSWPLSKPETELAPGAKLTVRVASKRRRAQLSFVRVNAAGKGLSTVAKRTLRRGSFTVTVPVATAGARYALRLNVAGRKRFSWVTIPVPPIPAPAAPVATPTPTSISLCGPSSPPQHVGDINPTLTLASTTVAAGETLALTVGNAGPGTFSVGGSAWLVPEGQNPWPFGNLSGTSTTLRAAEATQRSLLVPIGTAPGRYRVAAPITFQSCDVIATQPELSEPIEVLPG